jgi:hypothetical protein
MNVIHEAHCKFVLVWVAGVTVDNQTALTVQSLLDSQSLSGEGLPGATVVASRPPSKYL